MTPGTLRGACPLPRRAIVRVSSTLAAASALFACLPAQAQKSFDMTSGAMEPTIHRGQSITANLFAYVIASPARGDVVVFKMPTADEFRIYRVVALPGDTIAYDAHRQLSINGARVARRSIDTAPPKTWPDARSFVEDLPGARHEVLLDPVQGVPVFPALAKNPACTAGPGTFACRMPEGQYFLMGDNREHAQDSRFFGFVPTENIAARVSSGDTP